MMQRFASSVSCLVSVILATPATTCADSPRIEALSRSAAGVGDRVTVVGTGFGRDPGRIVLSGLRIEPIAWSSSSVALRVPEAGVSGPLVVRDADGVRSWPVELKVDRDLAAGQMRPHGFELLDTGLLGAAFLVETDGVTLYGVLGFETLVAYRITDHGPYEFLSRTYLPQRVGDIRLHDDYLFCAGDHGLSVYRCVDLRAGGAPQPVAAVFDGACLAVDVRARTDAPDAGVLVALCEYLPRVDADSDTLSVPLYAFEDEELVRLGAFSRPALATERQHAVAVDPRHPKVYVSGYETLFGADRYILEIDVCEPSDPVLVHREETGSVLAFDMDARGDRLWTGIVGTGTELFRAYRLHEGDSPLELEQTVYGQFGLGRVTRVRIIDDATTVGSAWSGARPDVFLLDTFRSGSEPLATASSIDWAFDVSGWTTRSGVGKIVVADEWGGFLTYDFRRLLGASIQHAADRQVIGAAMTEDIQLSGDRVYIAGRGAGPWSADRGRLADASGWRRTEWHWDESDPQPHPISGLATRDDGARGTLIAALGHDKAMAWGNLIYGILYRETDSAIELLAVSDAIDPPDLYSTGVDVIWPEEDLVFMTTGTDGFRAFVVDPDAPRIAAHRQCQAVGFAADHFSSTNAALCMGYHRVGDDLRIVIGSRPGLFVAEPTLHVFRVSFPDGIPDRDQPNRTMVVRRETALACSRSRTVHHLEVHPAGIVAAATSLGVALFDVDWVDDLNVLTDAAAWRRVHVPTTVYRPWWGDGWSASFKDVAFGDHRTLYCVKAPEGVWRVDLSRDAGGLTYEGVSSAWYPGVQCGIDYTHFLQGWRDPDIVTLHHPYALAADGDTVYVTGWSGKVERLSTVAENHPPACVRLSGPRAGVVSRRQTYAVTARDPEGRPVDFAIDWGDGTSSSAIGPVPSAVTRTVAHVWSDAGPRTIRVVARDVEGFASAPVTLTVDVYPLRGDANLDGVLDVSDAVTVLAYLFTGGVMEAPAVVVDGNCDGRLDVSDGVAILQHLFGGVDELCVD